MWLVDPLTENLRCERRVSDLENSPLLPSFFVFNFLFVCSAPPW
jgi:hypothetical protein